MKAPVKFFPHIGRVFPPALPPYGDPVVRTLHIRSLNLVDHSLCSDEGIDAETLMS